MTLIMRTEEQMQKELSERIKQHKEGQSRDGYVIAGEGTFKYRGIAYLIKILRYFNHENRFTRISSSRLSDCHVVVEYPDETKPIIDMIPSDYGSEFLYHDTLHSWNNNQIDEKIEKLQNMKKKLNILRSTVKEGKQ